MARDGISTANAALWSTDRYGGPGSASKGALAWRVLGDLDETALTKAIDALVVRHRSIRSAFRDDDAVPGVVARTAEHGVLTTMDVSTDDIDAAVARACGEPFDLATGPVFRAVLLRLSDRVRLLVLCFHRMAVDPGSMRLLERHLGDLYGRFRRDAGPASVEVGVRDEPAEVPHRAVDPSTGPADARWWTQALAGVPAVVDLPARPADATADGYAGHNVRRPVVADLAARMVRFCAAHACRPEHVLLAAYGATIAFWANLPTFAVGVPVGEAAADAPGETVSQSNSLLPIRVAVTDRTTFVDLVGQVRDAVRTLRTTANVPLAEILTATGAEHADGRMPFTQVVFEHWDEGTGGLYLAGLRARRFPVDLPFGSFELMLRAEQRGERFELVLRAGRTRYTVEDLTGVADRLVSLLGSALASPDAVLSGHEVTSPEEVRRITEQWQGRVYPPPAETTRARIAKVADAMPSRTAVIGASGSLTYDELLNYARLVASQLQKLGMRNRTVAVCLKRDVHWLPAILGIWLAGCVYLPLHTEWPPARRRMVLEDADAGCVLVSEATRSLPGLADVPLVTLRPPVRPVSAGEAPAGLEADADAPAYLMYTSGSTGRPKGVLVEHTSLGNLLDAMVRLTGLGPQDRMLAASAPTFDISLVEFLLPLMVGATCVVADDEAALDPALLGALVARQRITSIQATPSVWSVLLDHLTRRVRLALSGGEALSDELRDRLCRAADRAVNVYGPTETTIWATAWEMTEGSSVSIGRPLANVRAWVLDHWRRPCPVGTVGRLVIGGVCVAPGYLKQPEHTAEAFLPGIPGLDDESVYDTGDLACWRQDGQLYLYGRADSQIKLRGVRVEPGEVEAVVRSVDGVRDCAVVAYRFGDVTGLAAFVVAGGERRGDDLDTGLEHAIRAMAADTLPHHIRPQLYLGIDRLPRSFAGKLDRTVLADLAAQRFVAGAAGTSNLTDPLSRDVGEVWREVLGNAAFDGDRSFFSVGGDSLGAVRVVTRINRTFGTTLSLREFVRHPTVNGLAQLVAASAGERVKTPPVRRERPVLQATGAQRRFAVVAARTGRRLVVPLAFTVPREALDAGRVEDALGHTADVHPALRCRVVWQADQAVQEWCRDLKLRCEYAEVASDDEELAEVRRAMHDAEQVVDDAAPLVTKLVRSDERDLLLFVFDHAVVDEASLRLFLSGFSAALDRNRLASAQPDVAWLRYREAVLGHVELEATQARPAGLRYWTDKLLAAAPGARPADDLADSVTDVASNVIDLAPVALPGPAARPKLFPRLLAALHGALEEVSGADSTMVGYTWGSRAPDASEVMGCFINTLVSVRRPDARTGLDAQAAAVEAEFWADLEHAHVPFDAVVSAVNQRSGLAAWSGSPDAFLVFEDLAARRPVRLAGHDAVEWHSRWLPPKAPASLAVQLDGRDVRARLVGDPARLAERDANRLGEALQDRIRRLLRA